MNRFLLSALFLVCSALAAIAAGDDWSEIEKILQRPGKKQGNLLEFSYPRTDLIVTFNGERLDPAMGLTSWMIFKKKGRRADIFGEIVLLQKEVPLVMKKLKAEGLSATVVHRKMTGTKPVVMSLHFRGSGDPVQLVWGITPALSATGTPMGPPQKAVKASAKLPDWKQVEAVAGLSGVREGRALRIAFSPTREATRRGVEPILNPESHLVFQRAGKQLVVAGMVGVNPQEVRNVTALLARHGIAVMAQHDHGLFDPARSAALLLWGAGDPDKMSRGARAMAQVISGKGP